MALRVWLPLTGTLENKGISNHKIALTDGNTWTSPGKIGNNALTLTKLQLIVPSTSCMSGAKEISYAYWVKVNTAWSANWLDGIRWIETDGSATSTARQEFYTNCTLIGTWYNGGAINGKTFTPGVWTHLAGTFNYNTGEAKFYINGVLSGSTTNVNTAYYCRGDFCIGDNGVDICENDVRIYDHCLSAAEVHEISQGLVLHYKLDQPANINNNLYTGSQNFTGSWVNGSNWTTATETYQNFTVKQRSATWGGLAQNISCTNGDIFTVSFYAKVDSGGQIMSIHRSSLGNVVTGLTILDGNFSAGTDWIRTTDDGTQWKRYWATLQISSADITYLQWRIENNQSGKNLYVAGMKLEKGYGTTVWSPSASEGGETNIIQDSSGYNHNAISNGSQPITIDIDTPKYLYSTKFISGARIATPVASSACLPTNAITVSIWYKSSAGTTRFLSCTEGGGWNFEVNSSKASFPFYIQGKGYGRVTATENFYSDNIWHMLTASYDGISTAKIYLDGQLNNTSTITSGWENLPIAYNSSTPLTLGAEAQTIASPIAGTYVGNLSDLRIYCTALSDDAVKALYQVSAKVDNKGNIHAYEFIESTNNIIQAIESARAQLVFNNGLSKYTQTYCQITLTNDGYRIYREPNKLNSSSGGANNMWGGLKLVNQLSDGIHVYNSTEDNVWKLQEGHTYLWGFHAVGQSSNAVNPKIESNMGWDRIAGVGPNPTTLAVSGIPENFQGEKDCFQVFTITDTIVKTATSTQSSYTQGNSYLSYRHFCLNYEYTNTGALGTDLYLTNFRLYDITNIVGKITKRGQANFSGLVEQFNKAQIRSKAELLSTNFIEI